MSPETVGWILIGVQVAGFLATIALIGKPRQPATPTTAIVSFVLTALVVWGLVYATGIA